MITNKTVFRTEKPFFHYLLLPSLFVDVFVDIVFAKFVDTIFMKDTFHYTQFSNHQDFFYILSISIYMC